MLWKLYVFITGVFEQFFTYRIFRHVRCVQYMMSMRETQQRSFLKINIRVYILCTAERGCNAHFRQLFKRDMERNCLNTDAFSEKENSNYTDRLGLTKNYNNYKVAAIFELTERNNVRLCRAPPRRYEPPRVL